MGAGGSTHLTALREASKEDLKSCFQEASVEDRKKLLAALGAQGLEATALSSQRKFFVGANWKCSLESNEAVEAILSQLASRWNGAGPPGVELCIFPPYVYLDRARQRLGKDIRVGSQNAWDAATGFSCTGAVTASMIRAVGGDWVMLGHSDRRNVLGEPDSLISEKVARCLSVGLSVNLTIGEKLEAREKGEEMTILQAQLGAVIEPVSAANAWGRVVVAYEPVWAVGDGATPCSPEEAQRIHAGLRAWLQEKVGSAAANGCRFVYTGSVNEKNAADYAKLTDVDGFVVGRAGLDVEKLASICDTLVNCKKDVASHPGDSSIAGG